MNKNKKELIGALCFVALFGYMTLLTSRLNAGVKPYTFTIVLGGLLFSLLYLVRSAVALMKANKAEVAEEKTVPSGRLKWVFITFGCAILYGLAFYYLGYIISTVLYVTLFAYLVDKDAKKWVYPLVGVVLVVFLYFVFGRFLNVMLPKGILNIG